jgi:hypothetical protein
MRVLVLPIVAVGVIFFAHTDEPTENQMRSAFERSLAAEVADTMALIGESGGREAVERVRMAGNDRFEIRNFRKNDCQPMGAKSGFDCAFNVNIILANGPMLRSLKGRFYNAPEGLQFVLDESPNVALPTLAESTQGRYTESKVALKNTSNFNGE